MSQGNRLGLLGGTFDPVHIGHLHIAACALHDLELDEVLFVPAGSPPHKPDSPLASGEHRLRMLEIATSTRAELRPDPADLVTETPSYTSALLRRIRDQHPDDELWFVIGADSLRDFNQWHRPEEILKLARLAVADRPGYHLEEALNAATLPDLRARTDVFSSIPVDLSSTLVRERLREGLPVDWLVPDDVLDYITSKNLYR